MGSWAVWCWRQALLDTCARCACCACCACCAAPPAKRTIMSSSLQGGGMPRCTTGPPMPSSGASCTIHREQAAHKQGMGNCSD